jgi:hypothetical protein
MRSLRLVHAKSQRKQIAENAIIPHWSFLWNFIKCEWKFFYKQIAPTVLYRVEKIKKELNIWYIEIFINFALSNFLSNNK